LQALLALVLKISENKFRPIFARLSDWGAHVPAHASSEASAAVCVTALACRQATWFAVVSALSRALRSVFTPFFQNILETLIDALRPQTPVSLLQPRKKRKGEEREGGEGPPSGDLGRKGAVECELRRRRAVSCIHRCCMHDTTGFINPERFERILSPLVARLADAAVGRNCQEGGDAEGEDDDLRDTVALGERTRLSDSAVGAVAALVQLGASMRDDALWKRLNNQVRPVLCVASKSMHM
jgi:U3 small nucleolar RNA-associated protein 10